MSVWIQIRTPDTREIFTSSRLFVTGLRWVLTRKVGGRAGDQREPPLWHRRSGDNWLLLRNEHKVPHASPDPSFQQSKDIKLLGEGKQTVSCQVFLSKDLLLLLGEEQQPSLPGVGGV